MIASHAHAICSRVFTHTHNTQHDAPAHTMLLPTRTRIYTHAKITCALFKHGQLQGKPGILGELWGILAGEFAADLRLPDCGGERTGCP